MRSAFLMVEVLLLAVSLTLSSDDPAVKESGTIVTRLNNMIVVKGEGDAESRKYDLPTEAKIFLDGKPAKIDDLQPGDRVEISLTTGRKIVNVEATSGKRQGSPL